MYDVIVVGGGVSGTVAAIASARNNVKTLLIEKYGFCGGALTNSGVGPMMTFHAGKKPVIKGIADEIIERMKKAGASVGHIIDTTGYASSVTPFDAEMLKHVLDDMLLESGCNLLYHTMLAGVNVENGRIKSVKVCNKGGLSDIEGSIFIDTTGDADLSYFAGVKCKKGRDSDNLSQPMTTNLKIANVDIDKIKKNIKDNPSNHKVKHIDMLDNTLRLSVAGFNSELENAKRNKDITFERETVLFFETNNKGEVILNMTRVLGKDATDPYQLSQAEIEGRKQANQAFKFLKEYVPGFEKAVFISTGVQIGVRESRRIDGRYVLTAEDLLNSVDFDDAIAIGGYPIDIHNPAGNHTNSIHLKPGQTYQIPYRSLLPKEISNLLVSGRCISATHEAGAAIRVTPIVMAIGQAAGTAAALSVADKTEPAMLSVEKLKEILIAQGAVI